MDVTDTLQSNKRVLLQALVLFIGLLVFFSFNTWSYPFFDVDEPRYAETAREMLSVTGDWITPHFNFLKRFDKPVLFYWLIAGAYKLFGIREFSARLVSALAASLIGVGLFLSTHLFYPNRRRLGLLTAIVFATMLEPFMLSRWSVTDMTLACFMTGAWITLFLSATLSRWWFVPAGVFAGLGLLTKGPVALVLPGFTFLLYLACRHRQNWPYFFWNVPIVIGLLLCFAIAVPWYLAVWQANPDEFVNKFILLHNIQRFTNTVSGHAGPWYYYFIVMLIGALPWVLFFPQLCWHTLKAFKHKQHLEPLPLYAWLWFLTVFIFFSLSKTKLLTYILPAYPALAIILSGHLYQTPPNRFTKIVLTLIGVISLMAVSATLTTNNAQQLLANLFSSPFPWLWSQLGISLMALSLLFLAGYKAFKQPWPVALWSTAIVFCLVLSLSAWIIIPNVCKGLQKDIQQGAYLAKMNHATLTTSPLAIENPAAMAAV